MPADEQLGNFGVAQPGLLFRVDAQSESGVPETDKKTGGPKEQQPPTPDAVNMAAFKGLGLCPPAGTV